MNHTLVFPNELMERLSVAQNNEDTKKHWKNIGIGDAKAMISRIVEELNNNYSSLSIISTREETQVQIKERVENNGNTSKFVGYFENEKGYVDGLFFYIPPNVDSANDFISAKIIPPLFGIYSGFNSRTQDKHINCMPVFIVNLCTTSRVHNASVKKQIICCETLGFYYHDIFKNNYHDIINTVDSYGNPKRRLSSLVEVYNLLGGKDNKWFQIDEVNKILTVETSTIEHSSNQTMDLYRLSLFVIPALYMASTEGYKVISSKITLINGDFAKLLNLFITKIEEWGISMQIIYYGAPGTGKSYTIDEEIVKKISSDRIFRVTFHPEYTYSDFIGQLLPKVISPKNPGESNTITYDFQKGVFTSALEKAYENTSYDVYLIIEEMSRGNCAAIFGDVFQLLDREKTGINAGYSKYFITNELISKDIVALNSNGNKVKLPPNFHILGTVNTSDQNLFVMDTAFKRRFEWKYISTTPVKEGSGNYKNNPKLKIIISSDIKEIEWVKLYSKLNVFISDEEYLGLGEDKQLGQFFIDFSDDETKRVEQIKNKLLHYLWNDVHKSSYKSDISLFDNSIKSFETLYQAFEDNRPIFSTHFSSLLSK